MAVYWPEKKLIFIHVPKAAGMSIKDKLLSLGAEIIGGKHAKAKRINKRFPEVYNNSFQFCVVRNPWDRLYSYFNFTIQYNDPRVTRIKRKHILWRKYHDHSFEYWLEREIGNIAPQMTYIGGWRGTRIIVDHICRYETLQDDLDAIGKMFDFDFSIPHFNSSVHHDYKLAYNDNCKDIVWNAFKREINLLKYEF